MVRRLLLHALALCLMGTLAGAAAGCRRGNVYTPSAQTMYTLVNLHPDDQHRRLYSVNYQREGFIPRCTAVTFQRVSRKRGDFIIQSSGEKYHYYFHRKTMREPIQTHLDRVFGPACDEKRPSQLSEADQAGIRDGKVYQGMSKEGVILAIGYPPEHQTPTLESDVWIYWQNRFVTFDVIFVDGLVQFIRQ